MKPKNTRGEKDMTESIIEFDIVFKVKGKGRGRKSKADDDEKLSRRHERPEPEFVSRKGQGRNLEAKRYLSKTPKRRETPETGQAPFALEHEDPSPIGFEKSKKIPIGGRSYNIINRKGNTTSSTIDAPTSGIYPQTIRQQVKDQDRRIAQLTKQLSQGQREGIAQTQSILQSAGTGSVASAIAPQQVAGRLAGLLKVGGPLGVAIIALISAPEVISQLVKLLGAKGMPFNRDWHRNIETEVNGLFSIEEKKKRLIGIDQYVITQTDHYQPDSGASVYNSFENQEHINIANNSSDKPLGITYGN